MRTVYYLLIGFGFFLISSCKSQPKTSEEEHYKSMIQSYLFETHKDWYSLNSNSISRITPFDSSFTKVEEVDFYYRSLIDDLNDARNKIWEYEDNLRKRREDYSSMKMLSLRDEEEKILDKLRYRETIFKPSFQGYKCYVEVQNQYTGITYFEIVFDSLKTKIISDNRLTNKVAYELYISDGKTGTRNPYFKDVITEPCIESVIDVDGTDYQCLSPICIAIVNSKKHLLFEDGTLSDIFFDEPIKALYQTYTLGGSYILLIRKDGLYGVLDLEYKKGCSILLQPEYDKCEISDRRIIAYKDGNRYEFYPDGTPIK